MTPQDKWDLMLDGLFGLVMALWLLSVPVGLALGWGLGRVLLRRQARREGAA